MPIEVHSAKENDEAGILRLLAQSLRRTDDPRFVDLYRWKHDRASFGPSYRWVMLEGTEVIGVRLFMRWQFVGLGRTWNAVRAVDTATHPDHQGRGVFRALTQHALAVVADDGVDFVFNTPNDQSRPGYLKMGWRQVGRLRPMIRPRLAALARIAAARVPAAHWGEPSNFGTPVADVAEEIVVPSMNAHRLTTARSPDFARWRYPDEMLGYRAVRTNGALAIVRRRCRGPIVEAALADLQGHVGRPHDQGGALLRLTQADSVVALGVSAREGFVPLPMNGPTLLVRAIGTTPPPEDLARWALSLGDIELF